MILSLGVFLSLSFEIRDLFDVRFRFRIILNFLDFMSAPASQMKYKFKFVKFDQ